MFWVGLVLWFGLGLRRLFCVLFGESPCFESLKE